MALRECPCCGKTDHVHVEVAKLFATCQTMATLRCARCGAATKNIAVDGDALDRPGIKDYILNSLEDAWEHGPVEVKAVVA